MKTKQWICEICAEDFDYEVDLLAHQFNNSCERELQERLLKADNQPLDSDGKKPP